MRKALNAQRSALRPWFAQRIRADDGICRTRSVRVLTGERASERVSEGASVGAVGVREGVGREEEDSGMLKAGYRGTGNDVIYRSSAQAQCVGFIDPQEGGTGQADISMCSIRREGARLCSQVYHYEDFQPRKKKHGGRSSSGWALPAYPRTPSQSAPQVDRECYAFVDEAKRSQTPALSSRDRPCRDCTGRGQVRAQAQARLLGSITPSSTYDVAVRSAHVAVVAGDGPWDAGSRRRRAPFPQCWTWHRLVRLGS